MNLSRICFIAIMLMAFGVRSNSQQPPKAVLTAEFGRVTWEEYVARIDSLISQLNAEPTATAYIVIQNGKVTDNRERFRYEQWAKGHLKLRSFDPNRIILVRSNDSDSLKIRFWLVPAGAEKPSYLEAHWSRELPRDARPFVWTTTEWNNGLALPAEYLSLDQFSEVLEANPTARANFVIRAKTRRQHLNEKSHISRILVDKLGVAQARLRFFFVFENKRQWEYPQTEVWILP